MFTQCRGCGEIFPIMVDDLITANAMVRCSSCGAVFNALHTLSEYKPNENADLILHDNDNPPPLLTHEYKEKVVTENRETNVSNELTSEKAFEELSDETTFSVQPDFVADNPTKKSYKSTIIWVLTTFGLIGLLLWQFSSALKNGSIHLSEGQLKDKICAQVECFVDTQKSNLNKIALVSRSIRQHAGRDNALIITTGIINSDEKPQPFPALQIKMSNLNGDVVAMRRFLPSEYLGNDNSTKMQPNVLIPITLELQSPGKNAVAFEVGFSETYGAK